MEMFASHKNGFTLIELLIVVAIIGILSAIAMTNYVRAQIRAKVARAKGDMRSIATALELYAVDHNNYPPDPTQYGLLENNMFNLTTPMDYLSTVPPNCFPDRTHEVHFPPPCFTPYRYFSTEWIKCVTGKDTSKPGCYVFGPPITAQPLRKWALSCSGPNRLTNVGEWMIFGQKMLESQPGNLPDWGQGAEYDPTNGTISDGDIIRTGP